jgi:hypothetical protein
MNMPLNPDSPNTKDIIGPSVTKNLDKMHIHEIRIFTNPNGPTDGKMSTEIKWSEGYEDGTPTTYYPVTFHTQQYSGHDFESMVAENTTGGSLYGEIKNAMWAWLQKQGHAPAGKIV